MRSRIPGPVGKAINRQYRAPAPAAPKTRASLVVELQGLGLTLVPRKWTIARIQQEIASRR